MNAAVKEFDYLNQGRVRMVQEGDEQRWILVDVCRVTATDEQRFRFLPEACRRYTKVASVPGQAMRSVTTQGLYRLLYRGDRTTQPARDFLNWLDDVALPEIEGDDGSDEWMHDTHAVPESPLRFCVLTISNLMSDDPEVRHDAKDDALKLINLIAKLLEAAAAA